MKPFNIEQAKAGKPVCTRDGRNARIICFDVKHERFQLLALVEDGERECSISVDNDGKFDLLKKESSLDLFMKPEKHEGWVNIVDDGHGNHVGTCIWKTREEAEKHKPLHCVATTKIEWEDAE